MHDILEIRRHLVLMQNAFPEELQTAFRGMERMANPWNIPSGERLTWAEGLVVPTLEESPGAELLWWVGCAPATDPRAQRAARAFARILNHAKVDFAVLGPEERCTGDPARRAGNEYLYAELAQANSARLESDIPKRIVTTCPHCLHALKREYKDLAGGVEVVHHTQLLAKLLESGMLNLSEEPSEGTMTFHDPCYLGRQNSIIDAPREALSFLPLEMVEIPRSRTLSFCCGAGGAQMWKEEEEGEERVSENRVREVVEAAAENLAVGCPFCMMMLEDAVHTSKVSVKVRDVAELIAEQLV
jgi:Fe-S oxidoreductase